MKLHETLIKAVNESLMPRLRTKIEDLLPKIPEKAPGKQIEAMLRNNGVTDDELKWTKVSELLKKDKVTKDEIIDHLANHGLPFHTKDQEDKQYQNWALKGGQNYGEKTFHMDPAERNIKLDWELDPTRKEHGEIETWETAGGTSFGKDTYSTVWVIEAHGQIQVIGRSRNHDRQSNSLFKKVFAQVARDKSEIPALVAKAKQACEDYVNKASAEENIDNKDYKSGHWPKGTNPLFHIRHQEFKDADGQKVWLIEEIQSDWHQSGRKSGYKGSAKAEIKHEPEYDDGYPYAVYIDGERLSRHKDEASAKTSAASSEKTWQGGGVPNAPMKKSWEEMAFKWALHQAVDAKADRIGWITGEIAADRFDLSKQVSEIKYKRVANDEYMIEITDNDGDEIRTPKATHSGKELADIIGKDAADKITGSPEAKGKLSGLDLKMGGHGMKAAYDQRIPSIARKIAKQTGAMVGKTTLPDAEDEGEEVDPYDAADLQVRFGPEEDPAWTGPEQLWADDESNGDEKSDIKELGYKWWVAWEGDVVQGMGNAGPFDTKEEADAAREKMMVIREGKKGHEVWYMEINQRVRDLVKGGMRATFESEKPKATKPWWVI